MGEGRDVVSTGTDGLGSSGGRDRSLRDAAYEAIKADILAGDLLPGSAISEAERAEALRTSRTPIREALQALAQEGLVEIFPKRGTFVARLSARDVRESFELREAVETACARLAAERRTEEDLARMRAAAIHPSAQPADDGHYSRLADFHHLIVLASQNHYLAQAFEGTASRIDLASRLASQVDTEQEPGSTHLAVYEAIVRRDGEAAAEAMRRHLRGHAEALLKHLS
jgi:DNA-binding GntR family transcriptional regulator